jgi:hypothetical protein
MPSPRRKFDIFLSYKSEDSDWVNRLENSLRQRGVKVWRDKNEIRPGDLFASSLEAGLDTSHSVGLVVTPASLKSDWVRDEYYRALSLTNQRKARLIPLVRAGTSLPGFLSSRQCIDFRNDKTFESKVDSLVWPGITGHRIRFYALHFAGWSAWRALESELYRAGLNVFDTRGAYVEHGPNEIRGLLEGGDRVVVMTDVCCDFPWGDWPLESAQWMRQITTIRKYGRAADNEALFVLYQHPDALEKAPHGLTPRQVTDLRRYFTIPRRFRDVYKTTPNPTKSEQERLAEEVRNLWLRIQKEFMRLWRESSNAAYQATHSHCWIQCTITKSDRAKIIAASI